MPDLTEDQLVAFLSVFRPAPQGLLAESLVERTNLPAEDLTAYRERLEQDGFSFEEDEEGRWRLKDKPDQLLPYWIRAGLRCDRLASSVYYANEVESTQDIAFELMVEGRPHGTLIVAESQTAGRGRKDRSWFTTPGKSLTFSLLLDLEPPDTFASVLTIAIATSVARAIQDLAGLPAQIDFPNDILVRGKKVAGILLEVKDYGVPQPRAVAGIGINVNQAPDEFPEDLRETASSLLIEHRGDDPIPRPRLLRYILRGLEKWLDQIARGEFEELEGEWNRFAGIVDRTVLVQRGSEEIKGRVLEAGIRSGLKLRTETGPQTIRLEHVAELQIVSSDS
ncbi:MAG: biotin--[acetyl-CoA-carboxylase] ligase [Planctomycetota bacterium]|jgi:BirA family biotin operon repressor/biotin-[acetyl-CoA-carboxylase] ligase